MTVVLDLSAMRGEVLKATIEVGPTTNFIVPDVAMSEMAIKRKPLETMQKSLSPLRSAVDRLYATVAIGDVLKEELVSARDFHPDRLIDAKATRAIRAIALGESSADYNHVMPLLLSDLDTHRKFFDAEADKATMLKLVGIFMNEFGGFRLNILRRSDGGYSEDQKLGMILIMADAIAKTSREFATETWRRILYVRLLRVMAWAEEGGLESVRPAKTMNDLFDMDYVVTASYFDAILSNDRRVNNFDRQLRLLIDPVAAEKLKGAARDTGFNTSP